MSSLTKFWFAKILFALAWAIMFPPSWESLAGFLCIFFGLDLLRSSMTTDPNYEAAEHWEPPKTVKPLDSKPPQRPYGTRYDDEIAGV